MTYEEEKYLLRVAASEAESSISCEILVVTAMHKPCYGKCRRCVWRWNGGCSEWQ